MCVLTLPGHLSNTSALLLLHLGKLLHEWGLDLRESARAVTFEQWLLVLLALDSFHQY